MYLFFSCSQLKHSPLHHSQRHFSLLRRRRARNEKKLRKLSSKTHDYLMMMRLNRIISSNLPAGSNPRRHMIIIVEVQASRSGRRVVAGCGSRKTGSRQMRMVLRSTHYLGWILFLCLCAVIIWRLPSTFSFSSSFLYTHYQIL